jgi:signal transduction histidine kinase
MLSRTSLIYALSAAVWGIVVGWQTVEHQRVKESKRVALLNRPVATAKTLGKVIQSIAWDIQLGRLVAKERLETALKGLVTDGELHSIALLNAAGEPVVAAGAPIDLNLIEALLPGEYWGARTLTVVRRVDLDASETSAGETNRPAIVVPSPPRFGSSRDRTRSSDDGTNSSSVRPTSPPGNSSLNSSTGSVAAVQEGNSSVRTQAERPPGPGPGDGRRRRGPPPFVISEEERKSQGLHDVVIAISTASFRQACIQDLWLRLVIGLFAGVSVAGLAFAWRNTQKSSDLQMRLLRASELNSHLRQMNLAAAGLAHETRNPLNIIRGLAQMISKDAGTSQEIRKKTSEITDEVDRVTAQLNEFIDYSRPRDIRRAPVALNAVVADVARALQSDLEDKSIRLTRTEEHLTVEADEQFFRQVLFNLLLNAVQAVDKNGEIQIVARKANPSEACLEVRDNGPGVPLEQRNEIFKPYFTTHQKGTGLGLAVVQQIVLAHGWEIECASNDSQGALFRVSRMQLAAKA